LNSNNDTGAVCGIILAGGTSSRLGRDKASIQVAGLSLIERVIQRLRTVVTDIVLVANEPDRFSHLGLPVAEDVYHGVGTLGGLHAGLNATRAAYGLVVGCDMPFLNPALLRYMISQRAGYDVVIPRIGKYYEPLHAIYARRCLPAIERTILSGRRRVLDAFTEARVQIIDQDRVALYDPRGLSFFNVNTPGDLERLREILLSQEPS
jgi:molybdopterin-guanine dinucleotide biosynthesis protein A